MTKYKMNLNVIGQNVYSYNTLVAVITSPISLLVKDGYKHYSNTTSTHINYVAYELDLAITYEEDSK